MKNDIYVVLKLKTGETLFAELVGHDERIMELMNPFVVSFVENGTISMSEWIPFVDDSVHKIPHNICYYVNKLNKRFVKYYGSVVLQTEINKIKEDVQETMRDGNDYFTISEGVKRMKDITKELSEKFELDDDSIDFSVFEEKMEKHKPIMH